nr:hypothetical protein [Tanacetum cinerariifolium]
RGASGPHSSTVPAISRPGTRPVTSPLPAYLPWRMSTSGRLTPAACTRTSTWPAAGVGRGTSWRCNTSGPPGF